MLTTVAYVPGQDTDAFRSAVTNEVTGTGYTTGGQSVTGKSVTYDAVSNELRLLHADVAWPAATITGIRVAVLYKATGLATTDPLLGYAVLDGDNAVTNGTFTLDVDATAVLRITAA